MKEEEIKKLNIYEKMDMVTNEIKTVGKNLKVQINSTASYNAVSERDILDAVKPAEHKFGIYSYPFARKIVDTDILKSAKTYVTKSGQTTQSETNNLFLRIETTYRFVNLDNTQEFIDITSYSDGIDTGDKATGKAMTYGDKYAIMKAYKISTGDDPDGEASPEGGYVKTEKLASDSQIKIISELYSTEEILKALSMVSKEDVKELTMKEASSLIAKRRK